MVELSPCRRVLLRLALLALTSLAPVLAQPTSGKAEVVFSLSDPIVEITSLTTTETWVCPLCSHADLVGATLPPGFVPVVARQTHADYSTAGKLPSDQDVVTMDVDGLGFQRVARLQGGLAGVTPLSPGRLVRLESSRVFRFNYGREVYELSDGSSRYVLYVVGPDFDPTTLGLPVGWSLSSRVLSRDLVLPANGFQAIYIDEQDNLWQRYPVTPEHRVVSPWRARGARMNLGFREGAPQDRRLRMQLRAGGPGPDELGPDPILVGGWLALESGDGAARDTMALPASHWSRRGRADNSRGFVYRDPQQDNGPCRKVSIHGRGKIRLDCRGADLGLLPASLAEESLFVGLALGPSLTHCAVFPQLTEERGAGPLQARLVARNAPAPETCPFDPVYRLPALWADATTPVVAMQVRGRDADSPIVGDIAAVNIDTIQDEEADQAYGAAVFPLLAASGAALLASELHPSFSDTSQGPPAWAQEHFAMPHYVGAQGILGMTTSEAFGPLLALKQAQVGGTLNFGLQLCLYDCAALVGDLLPVRIGGRVLVLHASARREAIEAAAVDLAQEADAHAGLRLRWVGRTTADTEVVLRSGLVVPANARLGADATLIYELDPPWEPGDVVALPALAAFLQGSDQHVVNFFGP